MDALEFSRSDIEGLVRKLDTLIPQLSDHEQKLLLAIFAAAGDLVWTARQEGSPDPEASLTDLHDQLLNAFIPAAYNEFRIPPPRIGPPPPPRIGPPPPPRIGPLPPPEGGHKSTEQG